MKSESHIAETIACKPDNVEEIEQEKLERIDFHGVSEEIEYMISKYNLSLADVFSIEEELTEEMTRREKIDLIEQSVNDIEYQRSRIHTRRDLHSIRKDGDYGNRPEPIC